MLIFFKDVENKMFSLSLQLLLKHACQIVFWDLCCPSCQRSKSVLLHCHNSLFCSKQTRYVHRPVLNLPELYNCKMHAVKTWQVAPAHTLGTLLLSSVFFCLPWAERGQSSVSGAHTNTEQNEIITDSELQSKKKGARSKCNKKLCY